MRKIILLIFAIFFCSSIFSQEYEIKVKIKGIHDTTIYLGYYFGKQSLIADSAHIDDKNNAVFKGDKKLENGIYLIAAPDQPWIEIILGNDRFFSIETDTTDLLANMKIKNSNENSIFLNYNRKIKDLYKKRQDLIGEYELVKSNEEESKKVINKINTLNEERENFINDIINKYPDYFLSTYLKSLLEVKIPDPPQDENGNIIDPNFKYLYKKEHYFDNIDLSERGLLRTREFEENIDYYFSKMVYTTPDSLIKETHDFIQKVYDAGDSLMYMYTVSHLLSYFETSKIMGMESVFISIAEDWYLSGKTPWSDSIFIHKLDSTINRRFPTQLGKTSPDMIRMQSIDGKYYTLSQLPHKYILILFYEPDCGHCKKEVPEIMKEFRNSLKAMDVGVFAVYNQYDHEEWKKFIEDNDLTEEGWYNVWDGPRPHSNYKYFFNIYSIPMTFILDENKKIIANKHLKVETIIDLINFYENFPESEDTDK